VGKVRQYDFRKNEEAGADGLWVEGEIHKDYPIDDDVWGAIQDDSLNEMSIAGQFEIGEDGVADWAAPMEISLTGPAVESKAINPAATIEGKTSAKSMAYNKIMSTKGGETVSKLDEKINEKKSELDELINKKKAYADAAAKRKADADADAGRKADADADADTRKYADADARMKEDADARKRKAEEDSEALKMKDGAGEIPPKEEIPPEQAPPKAEVDADAPPPEETEGGGMRAAVENLSSRMARIEQFFDKIQQEQEEESSTDHMLERAEQKPGAGASEAPNIPEPEGKETMAKMSKDIARLTRSTEELVGKFSKFESAGMRKTVQSGGTSSAETPEVVIVRDILGQ
jgi:hypothetical protein